MIRVMFVCHGNICRSPMAEFILRDMVKIRGLENNFTIVSSATSTEELGNTVHYGTRNKLMEYGISTEGKRAVQLKKSDYDRYDYFIGMDHRNIINMKKILNSDPLNKVQLLLDFAGESGDIADPWYTGDFDKTYDDIVRGCEEFLELILKIEER